MRCMHANHVVSLRGEYVTRIESMLHSRLEEAMQGARAECEGVIKGELYAEAAMYADMLASFAEAEQEDDGCDEECCDAKD